MAKQSHCILNESDYRSEVIGDMAIFFGCMMDISLNSHTVLPIENGKMELVRCQNKRRTL
jgi:hypothetical protein